MWAHREVRDGGQIGDLQLVQSIGQHHARVKCLPLLGRTVFLGKLAPDELLVEARIPNSWKQLRTQSLRSIGGSPAGADVRAWISAVKRNVRSDPGIFLGRFAVPFNFLGEPIIIVTDKRKLLSEMNGESERLVSATCSLPGFETKILTKIVVDRIRIAFSHVKYYIYEVIGAPSLFAIRYIYTGKKLSFINWKFW